jgi:L,D-peptidoglycan transpeptidase YkuD (ErfK/YbiS/YcfS/YnhG family)
MKSISLLLCLLSIAGGAATVSAQIAAIESDPLAQSTQLIVVSTSNWSAVEGRLQRYERGSQHEPWRTVSESVPVVVGKNGLGWGIGAIATADPNVRVASAPIKQEGDGKAPAGIFSLGTAFGYAPQPPRGSKMSYLELTPSTECVDDVDSTYYNHFVDRSAVAPNWKSSEHMRSAGEAYRWGIVVDHNGAIAKADVAPPVPGGGSCIFLHIWKSPEQGTVGCTAMPQIELEALLAWIDPKRNPLLVQLPAQEYGRLIQRWKLPTVINVPKH